MAIDLDELFTRVGRVLHVAYVLTPYEASLPAQFVDIADQFQTTLLAVGGAVSVQADSLVRVASGVMSFATTTGQQIIQQMVLADQPSQALTFESSLTEVIRQMVVQAKTVKASAITITPTALPTLVGTGVLVTTTKRGDGLVQENTVAETLRIVCTNDAYTGTATQGQETFGLTAPAATAGTWDYDYPTGSGAATSGNAISASEDGNSNGNLLTNGDFQAWTPTTPDAPTNTLDNWTLAGGAAWGTDIQQDLTAPFGTNTYALQFLPGATNTILYQEFGDATTGTQPTPEGLASYNFNIWLRKLSGTISAGVLTIELTDDAGTVLNDAQGVANSFTVTLSTLTTSYVAYNGTFRLNATPPATIWLRLRISTALAGASFLAADFAYAPVRAMYQGGPGWNVFSGATPFVAGSDGWDVANTNDQGGASYLGTFQTGFDRLFDMKQLNQLLPSAGSPNIANTLISA